MVSQLITLIANLANRLTTILKINAIPPPETMNVGIIATIISTAVLIVLVAIVILALWRAKQCCFKPKTIFVSTEQPAQGSAEVQTMGQTEGTSIGVGADFGPAKPKRSASKDELSEPLLKQTSSPDTHIKLELLLPEDEMQSWSEEGPSLSLATSLSSLNTSVTEKDWEETLKSFGPKFAHISEMVAGVSESSIDGGSEV